MEVAGYSHPGYLPEANEDRIGWDEDAGVAVLADGMGGLPFGEVAARLAVETVLAITRSHHGRDHTWLESGGDPERLVDLANRAVISYTERDRRYVGMASTLALVCVAPDSVATAHIGDSRIYRWRDGELTRLTEDHVAVEAAAGAAGERGTGHGPPLARALGLASRVTPESARHERRPGDVYLLCSDGLTRPVPETTIATALACDGGLEARARALVEHALEAGGEENASAVLVRV